MSNSPFQIQMAALGLTLWNPTNETLDMQYAGISLSMEPTEAPSQEHTYPVRCAMHLLNAYGQRGLTSVPYGCTAEQIERIRKEAITRNIEFKKHQVLVYNQTQEQRKMSGHLGYQMPTPELKQYAIELGVKLMEPYSFKDAEMAAVAKTSLEDDKLKMQMAEMMAKHEAEMAEIKALMKSYPRPAEPPDEEPKKGYDGLRVRKNGKWVRENEG